MYGRNRSQREEIAMLDITVTTNPNISLRANYCPPTSKTVCFWSLKHENYAQIKTNSIDGVDKDYSTGMNFLIVKNPITKKCSRVDIREPRVQIGQAINRSKKLVSMQGGVSS